MQIASRATASMTVAAWVLSLLIPAAVSSQVTGGAVSGVVHNQTGTPVSKAKVTATNTATNQSRVTETDSDGQYRLPSLSIGSYEISVESLEYAKAIRQLVLRVNEDARVDFEISAAGASYNVDVMASTGPITESTNSVLGIVIEQKQIMELPLNGRNFLQLGTLVPNVSSTASLAGGSEGGLLNGPLAVSGQRDRALTFLVDGLDNSNSLTNGLSAQVSIDAIQEFKMITNTGSAEFGYHSGGTVNILTRAGSNRFEGSLFEFFRNNVLDAPNHFANLAEHVPSAFRNNQYGGTLGGPLIKDRTFFFGSYEGQRLAVSNPQFSTVPTESERHGIFTNPATGQPMQLPVDPVAANVLSKYVPLPNASSPKGNYLANPILRMRNDFALFKVDHLLTGEDLFSARYFVSDNHTVSPIIFNVVTQPGAPLVAPGVPGFGLDSPSRTQNAALSYTHNFNAQTINELRLGYNRNFTYFNQQDTTRPADLGFSGLNNPTGLPNLNIPGISVLGTVLSYPINLKISNFHLSETLSFIEGRHSVKAGMEMHHVHQADLTIQEGGSVLYFTGLASGISPLADFVLGIPSYGALELRREGGRSVQTNWGAFIQDDFQFFRGLVLNLGLRYELDGVLSNPDDQYANFSVSRGLFIPGVNTDAALYHRDYKDIAPRIGFAWSPTQDGRTVIRGGYGIFYDTILHTYSVALNGNLPGDPPSALVLPRAGPGRLGDAFNPAFISVFPEVPRQVFAYDENLRTPYAQHFNLNVQREFGNTMVLSLGYVGTRGSKLIGMRDINQAVYIPGVDQSGQPLSTPANVDARRPIQLPEMVHGPLSSITVLESAYSSTYHSFQVSFTKRLSRGLSLLSSYTWSKSIDNVTDPVGFAGDIGGPQNANDLRTERALSIFDIRHRFTIGYSYRLPFRGNRLKEGWQVNGLTTLQSGQPVTVLLGFDSSLTGSFNMRPNHVPGALISKDGQILVNPSLPRDPVTGVPQALIPAAGQFGTLGRNAFVGPPYKNFDLALLKDTRLGERVKLQVRIEVFNLLNTTNLALPQRILTDPSFGQSTRTQDVAGGLPGIGGGGPRVIQLALKAIF